MAAEPQSKSQERRFAAAKAGGKSDRDGLQDCYFPEYGVSVRAKDIESAKKILAGNPEFVKYHPEIKEALAANEEQEEANAK
jgi:hypothetical protein